MLLIGWIDVHTASTWRDTLILYSCVQIALLRPINASYTYISRAKYTEKFNQFMVAWPIAQYWGALSRNESFEHVGS